ncbi:MAG: hypothetical protein MUO26_13320 [Methanotrichaceae archaeon]|nr:hypothetical protein [Methanotrichaceae archaeon]
MPPIRLVLHVENFFILIKKPALSGIIRRAQRSHFRPPEHHFIVAVISPVALMSARDILSVSTFWNKRLDTVLNMAVFPLLLTFILIVVFKINAILNIM